MSFRTPKNVVEHRQHKLGRNIEYKITGSIQDIVL